MTEWSWVDVCCALEALGGKASNVVQGTGSKGRGLFPRDTKQPVSVLTPRCLLIPVEDIVHRDGSLQLRSQADHHDAVRQFFATYQAGFSFGCGGAEQAQQLVASFKSLPESAATLLRDAGMGVDLWRQGDDLEALVVRQFINCRKVTFQGRTVVAPVWELMNHDPTAPPFRTLASGLATPYRPITEGELCFQYSLSSPLHRVISYGFAAAEPLVFSRPFRMEIPGTSLELICRGEAIDHDRLAVERQSAQTASIAGLPIGHRLVPSQPFAYLQAVLEQLNCDPKAAELLWARILDLNQTWREALLSTLTPSVNALVSELVHALNDELTLMQQTVR